MRVLTIALLTCALAAAADSPFVGAWKFNKAKSQPDPNGAKIESFTTQFSQDGATLKASITTNGATVNVVLDGNEHPLPSGAPLAPNATHYMSTVNGKNISTVFKKDGKTVGTRKASLSADGKTITATTDATLPDGRKSHSVMVMDKQ
jgi:hypothetical protein